MLKTTIGCLVSGIGVFIALVNATYLTSDEKILGSPIMFIISAVVFVIGVLIAQKQEKPTDDGNKT